MENLNERTEHGVFADVYFQAIAIMKERELHGLPNNEGTIFFKEKDIENEVR